MKHSWVLDIIGRPPKASRAMGVYLTILYLRWINIADYDRGSNSTKIMEIVDTASQLIYTKYLTDADLREAVLASRDFVERLFQMEEALKYRSRKRLLDEIEAELYSGFVEAFKRYLKLYLIPGNMRSHVAGLLKHLKQSLPGEMSPLGTLRISGYTLRGMGVGSDLIKILIESGLAVEDRYIDSIIILAPSLSDDVLNMIMGVGTAPAQQPPVVEIPPPPPRCVVEDFRAKEILEKIVASALKHLGFDVEVDAQKPTRGGGYIDVDVWAVKRAASTEFRVYVSCKNWDDDVGRQVVEQEQGRTIDLINMPHLKIMVARSLTSDAERTALADGFLVIELGRKADEENAEELCRQIYSRLGQIFVSIAPPQLLEIASRLDEALKQISSTIESLTRVKNELSSLIQRPS